MKIEIWLYSLITAISCFNINLEDDILISKDFEMIMIDKKIFISISNKLKDSIDKYYFQAYNIQNERKYLKVWYSAEGDSNKLLLFQDLRAEDSSFSYFQTNENSADEDIYMKIIIIVALTLFAGIMSGLTVGYLSIDDLVLELKVINGTEKEKKDANRVLAILASRHWLLVTLLLINAAAMEALPLFLDGIVPNYLAIIISVTLVLLFGEIIPQALCTGLKQINITAFLAPFTKSLMFLTSPVSYPISLLLDCLFGTHTKSRFINSDLKTLIELHTHNALAKLNYPHRSSIVSIQPPEANIKIKELIPNEDNSIGLNEEQVNLMISALEMKKKCARDIMIKFDETYMLDYDKPIGMSELQSILDKGFSRIPVYSGSKNNLLGLLRIKQLVGVDFSIPCSIKDLNIKLKKPLIIHPETKIFEILKEFKKGKSHMAVITPNVELMQNKLGLTRSNSAEHEFLVDIDKNFKMNEIINIEGILTLEDVIENLINLEILDEDDYDKMIRKKNIKEQKLKLYKNPSYKEYTRFDTKVWAHNFINEESEKIENMIRESYDNTHIQKKKYKALHSQRKNKFEGMKQIFSNRSKGFDRDYFDENLI